MPTPTALSTRYQVLFNQLAREQRGAFIPFVTIGDPTAELSFNIIKTLIDAGADALELGIPFSDPSADGVTIQKAANRALTAGINSDICFAILAKVRAYAPELPIGLLLYGNLVFARGLEKFYQDAANAGVDSVLIADLPVRESAPFITAAQKAGINPIFIAPPNASDASLQNIAKYSQGYTYVLSRAGVTGSNSEVSHATEQLIAKLNGYRAAPSIQGFGISTPAQVTAAMRCGAAGAISGSAVVSIIEQHLSEPEMMLSALTKFVSQMKAATAKR
jgi:tryptophan synthase alpha chain